MNAKQAKKLRKLARMMAEETASTNPDIAANSAQVLDDNGTVMNNIHTVRGVYQYLKAPTKFTKRFLKDE